MSGASSSTDDKAAMEKTEGRRQLGSGHSILHEEFGPFEQRLELWRLARSPPEESSEAERRHLKPFQRPFPYASGAVHAGAGQAYTQHNHTKYGRALESLHVSGDVDKSRELTSEQLTVLITYVILRLVFKMVSLAGIRDFSTQLALKRYKKRLALDVARQSASEVPCPRKDPVPAGFVAPPSGRVVDSRPAGFVVPPPYPAVDTMPSGFVAPPSGHVVDIRPAGFVVPPPYPAGDTMPAGFVAPPSHRVVDTRPAGFVAPTPYPVEDTRPAGFVAPGPPPQPVVDTRRAGFAALPSYPVEDTRTAGFVAPGPPPQPVVDTRRAGFAALPPYPVADSIPAGPLAPPPYPAADTMPRP